MENNKNRNYYIFRISYDDKYYEQLKNQVYKGILRQGWGMRAHPSMRVDRGYEHFRAGFVKHFGSHDEKHMQGKFNAIKLMTEFSIGDIIIIPKVPDFKSFIMASVAGKYAFDEAISQEGLKDFGHNIPIEVIKTVNYDYSDDSRRISAAFKAYQRPINRIYQNEVQNAIEDLLIDEGDSTIASDDLRILNIYEKESFKALSEEILKSINSWNSYKLENIISHIFNNNGYLTLDRNQFDDGGDIDLYFSYQENNILTDILNIDLNKTHTENYSIGIQVKNKVGKDYDLIKGIEQIRDIIAKNKEADYYALMTTATIDINDQIDNKALDLARENNIMVIDGKGMVKLILKYGLFEQM